MIRRITIFPLLLLGLVIISSARTHAGGQPAQISTNLIAHWRLDEGNGTAAIDSSGNGYNGTIANPIWSSEVPPITGAGNYSLEFDGDTYIDTAAFDINDDFTIAFWMKTSTTTNAFIGKYAADDTLQFLFSMESSLLRVIIGNDFDSVLADYNPEWQHMMLVGRAQEEVTIIDLYRNGIPQYTYQIDNKIGDVSGGRPWTIGRMIGSNVAFRGKMADMRIYDGALSQSEIASLTDGFAVTCTVPSSAHADVDAALDDGACEKIEIAAGEHIVSYHYFNRGVIINGAGRDQTVLKVRPESNRMAQISKHAIISHLTLRDGGQVPPPGTGLAPNGALFWIRETSHVTLDHVLITNNSSAFSGGAIDNEGALTVLSSEFTGNSAGAYYSPSQTYTGGAIQNDGNLTVQNSLFRGNFMWAGGDSLGGAVSNTGKMIIMDTYFDDNEAGLGGALANDGLAIIQGVTMTQNRGYEGSAIFNTGNLQAVNSTISENSAYAEPEEMRATIHQENSEATMTLVHTTIADNVAADLIGLQVSAGSLSVHNTLMAGNDSGNCLLETPGQILNTGNMADDDSCQGFAFSEQIKLEPLADNGGPTPTQAIPADSAAVNAGDPAWCSAIDQRGVARGAGQCDAGAYEFASGETGNALYLPIVLNK